MNLCLVNPFFLGLLLFSSGTEALFETMAELLKSDVINLWMKKEWRHTLSKKGFLHSDVRNDVLSSGYVCSSFQFSSQEVTMSRDYCRPGKLYAPSVTRLVLTYCAWYQTLVRKEIVHAFLFIRRLVTFLLLDFFKAHDFLDFVFFVAANFLVDAAASAAGRSKFLPDCFSR